jgi:hypothetical protein
MAFLVKKFHHWFQHLQKRGVVSNVLFLQEIKSLCICLDIKRVNTNVIMLLKIISNI